MINTFSKIIYSSIVKNIVFLLLTLSFFFSRSFVGIYIFGFRIGEYLMALAFVTYVFTVLTDFELNPLRKISSIFKNLFILLFIFFIISLFFSNSNLLNPYTFKTSTYIWSFSFLFFGLNSKKINLSLNQVKLLQIFIIIIYLSSVFGYPDLIIELILQISDKYELHKGSDLALFYIIFTILINSTFKYNLLSLQAFVFNSSLYLPLLLFKSRSAFIGCFIIFLHELFKFFVTKKLKVSKAQFTILILVGLTFISISTYLTQNRDIPEEINVELISNSYSELAEYRLKHYQQEYPILYFQDGRIYSGDGNLNWRLIMWQDAIEDNINDGKLLIGLGYKNKFNVFLEDNTGFGNDRRGLDQLNEQVHNYFVTIFLRGGLIQLSVILFLYYLILKFNQNTHEKNSMVIFILSTLFISFFDSSMENSHFPLIFYYFLGNFYLTDKMAK
tara:strand:- start:226 stop:1560 length:1335 start_codon:yes stop_codon:yes gene_type:complete